MMRLATWLLARLIGTPAALAIAGDLAEAAERDRTRPAPQLWMVLLRFGAARLRGQRFGSSGGHDGGRARGFRRAPGAGVLGDARFALRVFRAHPLSTTVAVLSLGLGIGANTAIFSLLDHILLRPLPVPQAEDLVTSPTMFSYPDYVDLAEAAAEVLPELAAWTATARPYSIVTDRVAQPVHGELTTGNYFEMLQLRMAAGRALTPEDDAGEAGVAVISDRLWDRAFSRSAAAIGAEVQVNGTPIVIVGVAPAGFRGTRVNQHADLWVPLSLHPQLEPGSRGRLGFADRGMQWLRIMGRVAPQAAPRQAQAALLAGKARLLEQGPSPYLDDFVEVTSATAAAVPRAQEVRQFMTLLAAMVAAALLVACTNVANVLLTRTGARRRELGLRMALGAPRWRIVRQLLTESLMLSLAGAATALVFARWTLGSVRLLEIPGRITLGDVPTRLDPRTLAVTAAIALLCSLVFGVGPALAGTRSDVARFSRGATSARRGSRAPALLATLQVALTLALVFSGGLFVRSVSTTLAVDYGFERAGVFVADLDLGIAGYDVDTAARFRAVARERIEAIPGVQRAAWALFVPIQRGMRMESFEVVGQEPREGDPGGVALNYVSPGFFETLDVDLRAGRDFGPDDADGAPLAAIVNASFADHFWPDGDPLGQRLRFPGRNGVVELEIVGVAANTKRRELREDPSPYMYLPIDQWNWLVGVDAIRLAWRETGGAGATIDAVRGRIAELDPTLPMPGLRSLEAQIFDQAMPQRVGAALLGTFAAMALLLAAVGVYGVTAAAMASRTREIGIRRAVGARARDVGALVLRRGLLPPLVGIPLGWLLALAMSGLIRGFLPGLSPTDPLTMLAATAAVLVVVGAACLPSALGAARRDPVAILRSE